MDASFYMAYYGVVMVALKSNLWLFHHFFDSLYIKEKYGVRLHRAKFVTVSLFLLLIVVLSAEI